MKEKTPHITTGMKLENKINVFSFSSQKKQRQELTENMYVMLSSGLDIATSLRIMMNENHSSYLQKSLAQVIEDISNGEPLWKAFENIDLLPSRFIRILKVGEENGVLSENLEIVIEQQKKESELGSRIRSAMMYPAIVFTITLIVAIVISWFVLPRISQVYKSVSIDLPPLTRGLIAFGDFIQNWGYIAIPSFIISLLLIFYLLFFNPKTKHIGERIILLIPGISKLIVEVEIARLGHILGNMLKIGTPIDVALEALLEVNSFHKYKIFYEELAKSISIGQSFSTFFVENQKISKVLPSSVRQIIIISEKSGNLPSAFVNLGTIYEKKFKLSSQVFFTLLEPILLIIVWIIVATVALAIITPLYSLIGNF